MSRKRFHDLLWVVVVLAFAVAAFTALDAEVREGPEARVLQRPLFQVALAAGMVLLAFEARFDLHDASIFVAVVGFVTSLITGAIVALGATPHPVGLAFSIGSGLLAVAGAASIAWHEYWPGGLPDVLRRWYPRRAVHEIDGVQFVMLSPGEVAPGAPFSVTIVAQNCWNVPRTLSIELRSKASNPVDGLVPPPMRRVDLPGGAVVSTCLPVAVGSRARGFLSLLPFLGVVGGGGRRVRRRRAPAWQQVAEGTRTWLLAIGLVTWGGVLRVRVSPGATPPAGSSGEPETKTIWSPPDRARHGAPPIRRDGHR